MEDNVVDMVMQKQRLITEKFIKEFGRVPNAGEVVEYEGVWYSFYCYPTEWQGILPPERPEDPRSIEWRSEWCIVLEECEIT